MKNNNSTQDFLNSFFANTLHEIRTPIQTIIGTVELFSETPLDSEQTEYLNQIKFSADVLLSLANDVLDFFKIRSKQFKIENIDFNVCSLVERITDLICIEAFNKGLEVITNITSDVPELVIGDPIRIQQVLLNLLKNAVKFTEHGSILCNASIKGTHILFEVIDTGIGFSEATEKKLFTDYFQADASIARKYGGTGLGLSISKSLVSAMKGTIGAKRNEKVGSCFWFTIPLKLTKQKSFPTYLLNEKKYDVNAKVLVIDKNEASCKNIANKIKQCGMKNVSMAYTSQEALALIENSIKAKSAFEVAFVSKSFSELEDKCFAAEIKARKLYGKIKLFLVIPERQIDKDSKKELFDWYDEYLYKPVKREKLLEVLKKSIPPSEQAELQALDGDASSTNDTQSSNTSQTDTNRKPQVAYNALSAHNETNIAEVHAKIEHTNEILQDKKEIRNLFVLVAEDHPVNRKLIVSFLKKFEVSTIEATDGNEAIEMIQQHPETDIIFMDIQMPNKNGIEATDEIRSMGYKGIVIACTANNDFATVDEYESHGINDILIKPFKSNKIKETLLKWQDFCVLPAEPMPEELPKNIFESQEVLQDWNITDFEDTIDNNFELGVKLLKDFNKQTENLIKEAKEGIQGKNSVLIRRIGHTIKGSSLSLSIFKLADSAEKLNIAVKALNYEQTQVFLNYLIEDFDNFKILSEKWIEEHA